MATPEQIKNSLLEKCIKEIISYITEEDEETKISINIQLANQFVYNNLILISIIVNTIINDFQKGYIDHIDKLDDLLSQNDVFYNEYIYGKEMQTTYLSELIEDFIIQQRNIIPK